MSNSNTAVTAPASIRVESFLDDMLVTLQRRSDAEQRANIRWWREQVAELAKKQPSPVVAHHAEAA